MILSKETFRNRVWKQQKENNNEGNLKNNFQFCEFPYQVNLLDNIAISVLHFMPNVGAFFV